MMQAIRTLSHIEEARFFKNEQLLGCLKRFNLEQDPDYNTR